jgi:hypothetical protein
METRYVCKDEVCENKKKAFNKKIVGLGWIKHLLN